MLISGSLDMRDCGRKLVLTLACASGLALLACQRATTGPANVLGDTLALQIVRMDGGSGVALVSNGIPLPKGLPPDSTTHLALVVGGREQAIHVEALAGRYPDGSARALLLQFRYPVSAGSPVPALLITGPSVTRTTTDLPKTTVSGNMPAVLGLSLPVHTRSLASRSCFRAPTTRWHFMT